VIIITSKKEALKGEIDQALKDPSASLKLNHDPSLHPIVTIDGKVSTRAAFDKLNPQQIESVDVVKGEAALKKYDAPHGAVVVRTKKE